jgi:uncharacterized protein YneR
MGGRSVKIIVEDRAAQFIKEEFDVKEDDAIRIFVKYGGESPIQQGFSLGIGKDAPKNPAVRTVVGGITFFVEEEDTWYFSHYDLHVRYDEKLDEIAYDYVKNQ